MSDIPVIQIDQIRGPKLVLAAPSGEMVDIMFTNDGALMVSGSTKQANMFIEDIPPCEKKEETGTAGWAEKCCVEADLQGGNYEIVVSYNWRCSVSSKDVLVEVVMDGDFDNPIWYMNQRDTFSTLNQSHPITKFIRINNITPGNHKFSLWFACEDNKKIAYLSQCYMKIERKS